MDQGLQPHHEPAERHSNPSDKPEPIRTPDSTPTLPPVSNPPMLRQIRRDLSRAAPLTLVLGAAIGAGLTRSLIEPLRQGITFALETTTLGAVEIFAPVVVNLIWISCCIPEQVALAGQSAPATGTHRLGLRVISAMAEALLLLPYFVVSVLLASVLASPRPDLGEQLPLLLGALTPAGVASAVGRTALFAATSACLCHLIGRSGRHHPADLPILISTAIVNCSLAVILLEVVGRAMLSPSFIGRP
ncbi:hypothetical protein [Synechococcus sp. Tobar12-5m-g]|uniref:hypothetical protein n=2 Tax=unclassified Synechococcus TaxID=2626047 RepID=UPI0020CF654D|nr:hypothetical protein [Synechococcus sp. Tobar12-5m-g]